MAFAEEFFDIIKEIYCKVKGHIGSKKTVEVFTSSYSGIAACIPPLLFAGIEGVRVPRLQLTVSYSH